VSLTLCDVHYGEIERRDCLTKAVFFLIAGAILAGLFWLLRRG
jgi:hypothetical protein